MKTEAMVDNCPSGKIQYLTKREVRRAAAENAGRGRQDRYSYVCGDCGRWHLTQSPPQQSEWWWGNFHFRTKAV